MKDLVIYEGQWKNSDMEGQGTLTFHNGYFITGEWKKGFPFKASATWPNGNKYEGKFNNWEWHGKGKFSVPRGDYMEGEFRNHEPWNTSVYDKNGQEVGKIIDGIETTENGFKIIPKLEIDSKI